MLKVRHRAVAFASLACACLLAACDDAPSEAGKGAATPGKSSAMPKLADVPADMVAAVSAGKTSTAISLHFALRAPPTVNKALPVDLVIVPHRKFELVRVHFESREGLVTTAGEDFGPLTNVEGEKPLSHQLVLLPGQEGMFMLTASVETDGEEGNITRIYSIPIIVAGAASPAPPPAVANPPTGE